ncbi:lasso peptide biosynthesis B2 protein [Anabaena azotica]|uniref:Lasso peptide biosynthesis B2 protein n=1 Tax=Anabaena azotica FACHB-119 TaxID=947527 RepID=A0ABR8D4A4_9NOST|nr:lasso peptide biosynthesis B2 protein [Anabaena azotica]MBD2501125.1 lasso peptide biosynthesis B2 protein [Anabaena azotica FACHB-119]
MMVQSPALQRQSRILTGGNGSICLNEDVIFFISPDYGTVLDFDRGRFFGLDTIGSKMLALTLEYGTNTAITHLTGEYNAPAKQIEQDLEALLKQLHKKHLISSTSLAQSSGFHAFLLTIVNWTEWLQNLLFLIPLRLITKINRLALGSKQPSRFQVSILLTLAWFSLRLLGWKRSLIIFKQQPDHPKKQVVANSMEIIVAVDHVVRAIAARKLLFPVTCKERALVGYYLLQAVYDYSPTLVVGINCYPFRGHAWVECADRVLTDDVDHCEQFTPVARYN